MIVILKQEARQAQIDRLTAFFNQMGLKVHLSQGEHSTIMGLVGDTTRVDEDMIATLDDVEAVHRIQEPYKKANRKFHPADTVVDCGGVVFGKPRDEAIRLCRTFLRMIRGEASEEEIDSLEEASALRDVAHMLARVKCAMLGWRTLAEALGEHLDH